VAHADVLGARLWYEEAGDGPAVVLVHGGLGDARLWDEQFGPFSERFRTVRYDQRFYGRSDRPGAPYSLADDLIGLLDALEIERAALVGLSIGGRVATDATLLAPERVWALVAVAAGLSGHGIDPYTPEQDAEFEAAMERGDLERAAEIDLAVWAPLGADDRMRTLLIENAAADSPPEGAEPSPPLDTVNRLGEIRVPTLVVTGDRDVPEMDEIGDLLERGISGARRVRLDSDHYLPLREPAAFNAVVLEFLGSLA
jgi:pimeloyl-ACP methyl ester carboxylesterase